MKCYICKQSETKSGMATVTLQRHGMRLVFREVPAQVCPNCGEEYVDEKIMSQLLQQAEDAMSVGSQVDVRQYRERLVA
jgi:YgiT-type zinc finger domain-containing protein